MLLVISVNAEISQLVRYMLYFKYHHKINFQREANFSELFLNFDHIINLQQKVASPNYL